MLGDHPQSFIGLMNLHANELVDDAKGNAEVWLQMKAMGLRIRF